MKRACEGFLGWCVRRTLRLRRPFVIGVAGSVGKSSTKTAIGVALGAGEAGSGVVASAKNYNNELGVPLTIFGADLPRRSVLKWAALLFRAFLSAVGLLPLRAQTFVLEMGTDHPGDLGKLIEIAPLNVGVLTAVGPEHTEFFGGVEGVLREESVIITSLTADDVAVVNADDPLVRRASEGIAAKVLSFGEAENATARILAAQPSVDPNDPEASGLAVDVALYGTTRRLLVKRTVGRPQAYAVAAALACAAAVDQDVGVALSRLESGYDGMPGRMRLLPGIKRTWLIDDSYNSSPLAAISAIRDLSSFPVEASGRRIAALGDMLELGSLAESAHAEMGKAVADAGIDMLVACGTLAHVVAASAVAAGMSEDSVFTFAKSADAGLFIQERLREHDVVLVKGSQGVRMERVTKELMAHPERAEGLLVRHTKDWLDRV